MVTLCIDIDNTDKDHLFISPIATTPDNPHFKTDDKAILKCTTDWSDIQDGDFIAIENEKGVMEKFDNSIFKVAFNKKTITLMPLSSFVPYKEREVAFDELETVKLNGKILGIVRSFSDEFKDKSMKMF